MYASLPYAAPARAPFALPPHPANFPPELTISVLHTPEQRQEITHLRKYADFRSEYDVDPGMAAVDPVKDALGLVMAFYRDGEAIATMRFIPTGHGITLTERWWSGYVTERALLGHQSWEVGRLVMSPEHRQDGLLPQCMTMAFVQLMELADVQHMHATCHMAMTRLYRRFGFGIHAKRIHGDKDCALIHGRVEDVARCLKVALPEQMNVPTNVPMHEPMHVLQ
jgi:predicted GNAT family N-acyltransferase